MVSFGRLPTDGVTGSDVGGAELVDESLRAGRLLDDSLLVVLTDGPTEFVVVHRRSVLALPPQLRHAHRILDLEDSCRRKHKNPVNVLSPSKHDSNYR